MEPIHTITLECVLELEELGEIMRACTAFRDEAFDGVECAIVPGRSGRRELDHVARAEWSGRAEERKS